MTDVPVLLDSDTLSELSRGHPRVTARATAYLQRHGRLTVSAITLFERLRGYRRAIRSGRPLEEQLRRFEMLAGASIVLPVDATVADRAATIWAHVTPRLHRAIGDILIAATASAHHLPLITRNRRDLGPIAAVPSIDLTLLDWSR